MNFKQKLAYMTIGCVFTLAGYFLATLGAGGFNPQNATAQDSTKQVIDEITCRKLKIVNDQGNTVVSLEPVVNGGSLSIYNDAGKIIADAGASFDGRNLSSGDEIVCQKLRVVNPDGKTIAILGESLTGSGGYLHINNIDNKLVAGIGVNHSNSGFLSIYNKNGNSILSEDENGNGALSIFNKVSGSRMGLDFDKNGDGRMFITNNSGKVVSALAVRDGNGGLAILNKAGKPVMGWAINKNGDGRMFIGNKSGKPVVSLGAFDGDGGLAILNKAGKGVAVLGVEDDGGILSIANKNEIEVATLKANFGSYGTLHICDNDGHLAATLVANTSGQYIPTVEKVKERKGEEGAFLSSRDYGTNGIGILSIFNKNGIEVATLGTSIADGGILSIYNKEREIAARVGVDTHGWGGFQSFKGKWRTH